MPCTATRSPGRAGALRSVRRCQSIGDSRQAALVGDHHLGVPAVGVQAGDRLVLAVHEVAAATGFAVAAIAAEEADADALAGPPAVNRLADGVDASHHLMPRHPREGQSGADPLDGQDIRVADAARFHADPDAARRRLDQWARDKFQLADGACLHGAVGLHGFGSSVGCSIISPAAKTDNQDGVGFIAFG